MDIFHLVMNIIQLINTIVKCTYLFLYSPGVLLLYMLRRRWYLLTRMSFEYLLFFSFVEEWKNSFILISD